VTKFLLAVLLVALAYGGFQVFRFLGAGAGPSTETVVFEIPAGESFHRVADDLQKKGLILSATKMRVLAKFTGQGSRVKHGEYLLNKGMTPQEILSILVSGKSIEYSITFPEGMNIFEMANELEQKGFYKKTDFLHMVRDKKVIQELLGIEVSSLEGYLFPETYHLTKYTPLKELLASMVRNFKSVYGALEVHDREQRRPLSLTRHELVTLASIVEKETGAPEERPIIASVFYNRLLKNMRLQSDPTILYGIWVATGKYKQNLTKDDIQRRTPYNTYTMPKLPFGPICNPGREALAAVMNPAKTEDLYFVSRNDGTHIFTRSYADHLRAVRSFQLNPKAREGKSWRDLKKAAEVKH
jgi:UPF0755 protein